MPEQRHPGEENQAPGLAEDGSSKTAPYYLSFLSLVQGSMSRFHELLISLTNNAEGYGWRRIAACYALTDRPEQILEVYRIPDAKSLTDALEDLGRDSNYRALVELCKSRQMELTRGLPYDPGVSDSSARPVRNQLYFLEERLTLKADQQPRFIKAMQYLQQIFQRKEWSLSSASRSLTPPYRVMHLWQFRDADQLDELMRELPREPRYADLEDCCESQWQRLTFTLESLPDGWWASR
jgi:hypothetical protein